jgi:hypothetical protein
MSNLALRRLHEDVGLTTPPVIDGTKKIPARIHDPDGDFSFS